MDELNIAIDGKSYACRFEVKDAVVTVHSSYGTDSTQQGGLPAINVAERLLRELVRKAAL
jgi:glutamate mutase epsilon subunit